MRMTVHEALIVGRDPSKASAMQIIEARRTLKNIIEEAQNALGRVEADMKSRMVRHREAAE